MTSLLILAGRHWRLVGAGLLAAVILAAFAVQGGRIARAERARDEAYQARDDAQARLAACRGNVAGLEAELKRQNAAVERLGAESRALMAESRRVALAARSEADRLRRRASSILAAKPGPDVCASADALILKEAGR